MLVLAAELAMTMPAFGHGAREEELEAEVTTALDLARSLPSWTVRELCVSFEFRSCRVDSFVLATILGPPVAARLGVPVDAGACNFFCNRDALRRGVSDSVAISPVMLPCETGG